MEKTPAVGASEAVRTPPARLNLRVDAPLGAAGNALGAQRRIGSGVARAAGHDAEIEGDPFLVRPIR